MASLDDYHFLENFKRKRIKLTIKDSTVTGVVQRISLNKTIVLEDVQDKNGRNLGVKMFFGHEILKVEFSSVSTKETNHSGQHTTDLGQLPVIEFQPYRRQLLYDGDNHDNDELHVVYVVIDEFHEKFGPAVMHIKKQQVIGIGADGVGVFQHERLCWLQIATKNKVYLFDILLLGARAFKNGLSMILESNCILKVTHDSRCIAGCLMAQFGVNLSNVFDTQVADIMHFYGETGGFLPDRVSTLQEVVSLHLKMPLYQLSSLKIKAELTREDKEVWYMRPCPAPLLKVMALSVIHLQPLRLVLLDALMSDYTNLVDSYLRSNKDEPVHMQHIGKSVPELPKELRELQIIRQERQEWALNHYTLTEDGLLKRYSVKPSEPQSKEQADPEDSAQDEPSLLEESTYPKISPDHLCRAKSAHEPTGFTALGRGKSPDKDNILTSTAVPGLGRGSTVSAPVEACRESLLCEQSAGKTNSDPVGFDATDSVLQPISVMAGVAQRGTFPDGALNMGRGLYTYL